MNDWEIQPIKKTYSVGEKVIVRPAIVDGLWEQVHCRNTFPARVVYVHPTGRYIVVEYQVYSSFFGKSVATLRESFLVPQAFCQEVRG